MVYPFLQELLLFHEYLRFDFTASFTVLLHPQLQADFDRLLISFSVN